MRATNSKPIFFKNPSAFREWLEKNHGRKKEVLVGFYKRASGKPSLTWPESVDAALSYGWIDGVRKSIDNISDSIRFTPRKPASTWSAINVERVAKLTRLGLMRPAGMWAFQARRQDKTAVYAYEQQPKKLPSAYEQQFQANRKAWDFFQKQPPWYQRTATYYVISAKRQETCQRRLAELIRDCAEGLAIKRLRRPSGW
ncbi:MAG: YdeI/OmpD-associated family protein [Acidobacteria bacterium]|nr:YdeI/OmpD-associated family protein [Acidobacteriota bacterium]